MRGALREDVARVNLSTYREHCCPTALNCARGVAHPASSTVAPPGRLIAGEEIHGV
jgi:hypothetical protein